jgi:hypothetical protein
MNGVIVADGLGAVLVAAGLVASAQHQLVLSRILALGAVAVWHVPDLMASTWAR